MAWISECVLRPLPPCAAAANVLLLEDTLAASGLPFLLGLLKDLVDAGERVCLVASARPAADFARLTRKLGLVFDRAVDDGRLVIVEEQTFGPPMAMPGAPPALGRPIDAAFRFADGAQVLNDILAATGASAVIFDDAAGMADAYGADATLALFRYTRARCQTVVVAGIHSDAQERGSAAADVLTALRYDATAHLMVDGLSSGRSVDVDGVVRLAHRAWPARRVEHFRVTDAGLVMFHPTATVT